MVLIRALIYATLFMGLVLVFVPASLLATYGVVRPATFGVVELVGIVVSALGAALAVWCVLTFAFIGKGTPALFDPPRYLVIRGPYRFVRNPMYIGAGLAVGGAALVYHSWALAVYLLALIVLLNLLVAFYEEPTLTRMFGAEYEVYKATVPRWIPRIFQPGARHAQSE
jgi:protein-S-isoprenylcysteine O-methyltransferase Ste14